MVLRLWVPLTHWLWARNWNLAASGACLTASRVAKRVAVSTPLRAVMSVVVILVRLLWELVMAGALWPPSVSAVFGQAVASRRSPGIGRAASSTASLSMAALNCFWSWMNVGAVG